MSKYIRFQRKINHKYYLRLSFVKSCISYIHQIFMLKNKIYKYFVTEIIKSFLTILFALTAIAWTVRAVNFLDLIVENGHSISTYLFFSFLNVTNIITKFIPLSFLLALFLSILKFERKNELLILWTNGFNKIKLANLFLVISIVVLIVQLFFAVILTPNALNKSRNFIKSSGFDSMTSIIKINDFSDSFRNVTMYVSSKDENNELTNIFIRDTGNTFSGLVSNKDTSRDTTITAEKGYFDKNILVLTDGTIQTKNENKEINTIYFKRTQLSMSSLVTRTTKKPKLQETLTPELINCFFSDTKNLDSRVIYCPRDPDKIKEIIVQLSRRFGMPIYIPLIAVVCSFLLISPRKKKYSFLNNYIYFLIGFVILTLAEILVRYSGFSKINTVLYFLFPITLSIILYLILIKKLVFEKIK
jgi:lipopolysaccharide export system permease protein